MRDQYAEQHVAEPSEHELQAAGQMLDAATPPEDTAENNFLLYWTLLACPWPAQIAHCNGAAQPTAMTLGKLFDYIELPNSRIRALSNEWTDWAEREIIAVAKARLAALEARGIAPLAGAPTPTIYSEQRRHYQRPLLHELYLRVYYPGN